MIKAEKGFELPTDKPRSGRPKKYPWLTMKVGESFFVKSVATHYTAYSAANRFYSPRRFIARKVAGGFRVWRTK